MTFRPCPYECEVVQALHAGHWPRGCSTELRAHVHACADCSDLVFVTETFQQARRESEHASPIGSPGLLWWKAQLQRRNATTARMSRPITVAQTFAVAMNVLVTVIFVASQYDHGLRWSSWWSGLSLSRVLHLLPFGNNGLDWNVLWFMPALGAVAFLSGLVVYLASEK